jgi:predicted enzyme related to lactoylglutathione lyase
MGRNDVKIAGSSRDRASHAVDTLPRGYVGRDHERMEATTMAISGIAFAMYPVTDMARAVTFYRDVLGLTKHGLELEYWIEFDVAGATFGIGNFEQVGVAGSAQSLALEVADLAALRTVLASHGVASSEPFETPVCRISETKDPDGNRIWLHEAKPS